jgi:hypothetical protein
MTRIAQRAGNKGASCFTQLSERIKKKDAMDKTRGMEDVMKDRCAILRIVLLVLIAMACCGELPAQNASREPAVAVAKHSASFAGVDDIMNAAIAQGTIPGGVVLVGHDGQVVYRKAYGMRSLEPDKEA